MPERKGYKKWLIVAIHAIGWVTIFALPDLLKPSSEGAPEPELIEKNKQAFTIMGYLMRGMWVGFFYLHAYVLIPKLAYKGKILRYVVSIIVIILFWIVFGASYFRFALSGFEHQPFSIRNSLIFATVPTLFLMICSAAYKLIVDRIESERREREKQNENLKTELSLLRSQVSPHFMFNVLNGMVSLARKKSDLLETSLIKLSHLLRYMLYETDARVPLQKEVEYLQSYIDLQQQRFGSTVEVHASFDTGDEYHEIEPMLLIPFVENAFKHGVVMVDRPEINIHMQVEGDRLTFRVGNSCTDNASEVKDAASGIGLGNVKRRLELLYPQRHKLDIRKTDNRFEVELQITLS